jgi:uncharacterized protein
VTVLYADTSAIARAYFEDEPDHLALRALLLDGADPVVTSELARVEFATAVNAAMRAGRATVTRELIERFDVDCQPDGPVRLLKLEPEPVLRAAYQLVLEHRLRTLDAVHLAVASTERDRLANEMELAFVTRDGDQSAVAAALGFEDR